MLMRFDPLREFDRVFDQAWSQTRLAQAAGMTQSAVARFEAGGTVPTLPVLERLANALGEKRVIFGCLLGSAENAAERGEMARAARQLGAADALREAIGNSPEPFEREQRAQVATALGDDAALLAARSEGQAQTLDDAVAYALGEPDPAP